MTMHNVSVDLVASPKRISSLAQRLMSVIVILPLILLLIYWGVWSLALTTATAVVVCLVEYYRALTKVGYHPRPFVGVASGLLFCCAALFQSHVSFDLTGLVLSTVVMLMLVSELLRHDHEQGLLGWALTFAGACYIGWLFSYYILLGKIETPLEGGVITSLIPMRSGAAWVYLVLAITWIQDGAAYFVGRSFGRHKMAPTVSPNKSWEGAIGGFFGSILASVLTVFLLGLPISYPIAILLGAIGGVVAPIGDLAESTIKRRIGLKDMGNIMPGHGGLFDRADSMLFAAPVLYYMILFLT